MARESHGHEVFQDDPDRQRFLKRRWDLPEGGKRGRLASVRVTLAGHDYGNSNRRSRRRVPDRAPAERLSSLYDHGWHASRRRGDCTRAFETESLARRLL